MPLFSVGVTTYNRKQLLRRCLDSLVNQSFRDFEVIVGNDYIAEPLFGKDLGIEDPRIRFINHAQNLGEWRNLNALLAAARGEYFTWQFDDDLYAVDFFERAQKALAQSPRPACVFTSYRKVFDTQLPRARPEGSPGDTITWTGPEFLRRYLSGRIRAMGMTGVYNTEYIRAIRGVQPLTDGPFALYSEYLLMMQTVLLDRVVFINSPLVYYFVHEGSWGNINAELDLYRQAAANLLTESNQLLRKAEGRLDREWCLESLLKLAVADFTKHACMEPGFSGLAKAAAFSENLTTRFLPDRISRLRAGGSWFVVPFIKAKLKRLLPLQVRIPIQKIHARFQ